MIGNRPNILLVEDHGDTRELLTFALSELGCSVSAVATITDATREIANQRFDLFILDSRLPDGSGLQLCQHIRDSNHRAPIVFCSADAYTNQIQKAVAAGAQLYLTKPFDIDQFQEAIRVIIDPPSSAKRDAAGTPFL